MKTIKVMSFNLKDDMILTRKHLRFSVRFQVIVDTILTYDPDILCVQECTIQMKQQLTQSLSNYAVIGKNRAHLGAMMNEANCIFYKKERFVCLHDDTFWLSRHPEKQGSRSWLAIFPRICTHGYFLDTQLHTQFHIYNTHLDHLLPLVRQAQIQMVLDKIPKESSFLCGDMNTHEPSRCIQYVFDHGFEYARPDTMHNTIHSGAGKINPDKTPIDFIFSSTNFKMIASQIITHHQDTVYPSDHFPVMAEFELKERKE